MRTKQQRHKVRKAKNDAKAQANDPAKKSGKLGGLAQHRAQLKRKVAFIKGEIDGRKRRISELEYAIEQVGHRIAAAEGKKAS